MRRLALAAAVVLAPSPALADADAGTESVTGCVESVPKGAQKPLVVESFPPRGTSGWAATLHVLVRHGKGERVLPNGLDLSSAADAKKYLHDAGFSIPDQQGTGAAQVWSEEDKGGSSAVTHLVLPLVVLPEKPGRQSLVLPPLPVAVARANGEIATVCTHPHSIQVEDPIASTPDPKPKSNPPPRPQREEWTALKKAVIWGGLGLAIGVLLGWLIYRQVTKPKPPPPPPPPRPPWEIALEKLDEVRHAGLIESQRYAEHFDRVSDAVRGYLGARFGFDGLESTTDEILAALKKHAGGFVRLDSGESQGPSPGIPLGDIEKFLFECDLVKFAKYVPTSEQCATAIGRGEHIVRGTMPFVSAPKPHESAGGGAP